MARRDASVTHCGSNPGIVKCWIWGGWGWGWEGDRSSDRTFRMNIYGRGGREWIYNARTRKAERDPHMIVSSFHQGDTIPAGWLAGWSSPVNRWQLFYRTVDRAEKPELTSPTSDLRIIAWDRETGDPIFSSLFFKIKYPIVPFSFSPRWSERNPRKFRIQCLVFFIGGLFQPPGFGIRGSSYSWITHMRIYTECKIFQPLLLLRGKFLNENILSTLFQRE